MRTVHVPDDLANRVDRWRVRQERQAVEALTIKGGEIRRKLYRVTFQSAVAALLDAALAADRSR